MDAGLRPISWAARLLLRRLRNRQPDFHRGPCSRRTLNPQTVLGTVIQREPPVDIGQTDVPAVASGILSQFQGKLNLQKRLPIHAAANAVMRIASAGPSGT